MEIKRYCATCAYKSNDIFDDECRWCNMTSDSMSGWTPAENKPLSDYTDSELEEELARRKRKSRIYEKVA